MLTVPGTDSYSLQLAPCHQYCCAAPASAPFMPAVSRAAEGDHLNAQVAHASLPSPPPGHLGRISTRTTRQKTELLALLARRLFPRAVRCRTIGIAWFPLAGFFARSCPLNGTTIGCLEVPRQASPPPRINAGPPHPVRCLRQVGPMDRTPAYNTTANSIS
jgi:hypothetical protein